MTHPAKNVKSVAVLYAETASNSKAMLVVQPKNGQQALAPHNKAATLLYEQEFKSLLYYNPIVERWYQYQDSGIFSARTELKIQQEVFNAIERYCDNIGFSASYVSGVSKCLLLKAVREQESNNQFICFKNGVLDLKTRQLLPHSPDYFFTSQLPFDWIPNAPYPKLVVDWLKETVGGHDDQVQLLRAFLNAIITGRSDLQRFLELVGYGGTGKSTFIRLCTDLVGKQAIHSTMLGQLEENRFETSKVFGKKLVVITDAEKWHKDVSVLKSITGQDPVRFEEKNRQSGDSFIYDGMVLIAANQHTTSTDYSSGIQRRRITVEFNNVVDSNKCRDLNVEFEPLLPAIVKWVLDMSKEEVTKYLRSTKEHVSSLNSVRTESLEATNPIAAWLLSNATFSKSFKTKVGVMDKTTTTFSSNESERKTKSGYQHSDTMLYPNYCLWCQHNNHRPISLNQFSRTIVDCCRNMLDKPFVEKVRVTDGTYITGVAIKNRQCISNDNFPDYPDQQSESLESMKANEGSMKANEGSMKTYPIDYDELSSNVGKNEYFDSKVYIAPEETDRRNGITTYTF